MALNGLSAIALDSFGGLDMQTDPGQTGPGAVNNKNVVYDRTGSRVGSRWGFTPIQTLAAGSTTHGLARYMPSPGTEQFLVNRVLQAGVNYYVVYTAAGVFVTQRAMATSLSFSSTSFGTPTTSRLYFADGTEVNRLDTGVITNIFSGASPYVSYFVCATNDGRLAYANLKNGALSSRVQFSDPAAPETITANNYVDLSPGDGEPITGVAAFREQLFVFKRSKYFVFYGTSTDATGNPIFNYRTVSTGIGSAYQSNNYQGPCAGRDGVYFSDGSSIYKTTGGDPISVSHAIDPILVGPDASVAYAQDARTGDGLPRLRFCNDRVYAIMTPPVPASDDGAVYVLDTRTGLWAFWDANIVDVIAPLTGTAASTEIITITKGQGGTPRYIARYDSDLSTDNGLGIDARFQSGFMDFGSPGAEKVIRQTELTGRGSLQFSWVKDYDFVSSPTAVTLGAGDQIGKAIHQVSYQGENLSYAVQSTGSASWELTRVTPMVRSVRGMGEVSQ